MDNVPQVNPPITFAATEAFLEPVVFAETVAERFRSAPRAPEFAYLFETHFKEIKDLIFENKRVATVWHRCRGPIWTRLAIVASHSPGSVIPAEVDGVGFRRRPILRGTYFRRRSVGSSKVIIIKVRSTNMSTPRRVSLPRAPISPGIC